MMREGFADRFGIQDPDQLTVRDLIQTAESSAEAQARAASPLAQAEWEVAQFGSYADELGREAERLQGVVEDAAVPGPDGEPKSAPDHEWATSRLAAVQDLQGRAVDEREARTTGPSGCAPPARTVPTAAGSPRGPSSGIPPNGATRCGPGSRTRTACRLTPWTPACSPTAPRGCPRTRRPGTAALAATRAPPREPGRPSGNPSVAARNVSLRVTDEGPARWVRKTRVQPIRHETTSLVVFVLLVTAIPNGSLTYTLTASPRQWPGPAHPSPHSPHATVDGPRNRE